MDEHLIRQYLLGELGQAEQRRCEERLMSDDEYYQTLLLVEDELIDEYVRGKLSPVEKERVEHLFLASPERQQKLHFAKALHKYVASAPVVEASAQTPARKSGFLWGRLPALLRLQHPAVGLSLVAALLLLMLGNVWMWFRVPSTSLLEQPPAQRDAEELQQELARQRDRNRELTEELLRAQNQRLKLEEELAALKNQPERKVTPARGEPAIPQPSVFPIVLTSALVRGSEGAEKSFHIPPNIKQVRLNLVLAPDDYRQYRATLEQVGGASILSSKPLRSKTRKDRREVSLSLPAKRLPPGDYRVKVSGLAATGEYEEIGKYYFRILEK